MASRESFDLHGVLYGSFTAARMEEAAASFVAVSRTRTGTVEPFCLDGSPMDGTWSATNRHLSPMVASSIH